jgi:hypothetical protein
MRRIKYSTKGNQIKVKKNRFDLVNPENDVIHDAQKVIWNINLKKIGDIGKFGQIGSLGYIGAGSILDKNCEIA